MVITVDKCVGHLSVSSTLTLGFTYYPPTITASPEVGYTRGGVANVPPGLETGAGLTAHGRGGRGIITLLGHRSVKRALYSITSLI